MAAISVDLAHPSQVSNEVSLVNEVGQNLLVERWRITIGAITQLENGLEPLVRRHDVPASQGREQGLIERFSAEMTSRLRTFLSSPAFWVFTVASVVAALAIMTGVVAGSLP
jgi:hypothetical protein